MKKLFFNIMISLFLIDCASTPSAFGQKKYQASNSLKNSRGDIQYSARKTSDIYSEINMRHDIKLQTPQQPSSIQKYDSIYYWDWHTVGSAWGLDFKDINMVYDPNNNLISVIRQFWNATTWVNNYHWDYTYDANNNLTSEVYQQWNNNAWENFNKYAYTYDISNNRISELGQVWSVSAWVNDYYNTFTYNPYNNLTSEVVQTWYNNAWVTDGQDIYTYDANNNLTSELEQGWNGSTWDNAWQRIYMYDAYNNRTSEVWQNWINSTWENELQAAYSYDVNKNKISALEQHWNGGGWVNYDLRNAAYNATNYLISESEQGWNGNTWDSSFQTTYTYDVNNNLTNAIKLLYINGSTWRNNYEFISTYDDNNFTLNNSHKIWNWSGIVSQGDSTDYYFHTIVGKNNLAGREGSITVYPNPTSTITTISTTIKGSFSILNINGTELLHQEIIEPNTTIDVSTLPNGVYFLRLTGDKNMSIGKLVKQ